MSSLFSKPETPKPVQPPTIDEARKNRDEMDQRNRRKGRLAQMITGKSGAGTSTGGGAAKALLGG